MTFLAGIVLRLLGVRAWLKSLPWQAWAILAAVALLALGWWQHGKAQERAFNAAFNAGYEARARFDAPKFAIQDRSIAELTAVVAQKNAESIARAKALDASRSDDVANVRRADAAAKATRARIETIRGIGEHSASAAPCKAPDALLTQMEGL